MSMRYQALFSRRRVRLYLSAKRSTNMWSNLNCLPKGSYFILLRRSNKYTFEHRQYYCSTVEGMWWGKSFLVRRRECTKCMPLECYSTVWETKDAHLIGPHLPHPWSWRHQVYYERTSGRNQKDTVSENFLWRSHSHVFEVRGPTYYSACCKHDI